jgi:hypothetical protein
MKRPTKGCGACYGGRTSACYVEDCRNGVRPMTDREWLEDVISRLEAIRAVVVDSSRPFRPSGDKLDEISTILDGAR